MKKSALHRPRRHRDRGAARGLPGRQPRKAGIHTRCDLGAPDAPGLDFELVMATNQDGLGTEAFPEEDFRPPHEKCCARSQAKASRSTTCSSTARSESDDAPTRKPRTGMFGRYTDGSYDLGTSYVVGDRATDILLARNLGAKGILLAPAAEGRRMLREAGAEEACVLITDSWAEIAEYIRRGERRVVVTRETRETQITVRIDLDGRGFGTCGPPPATDFHRAAVPGSHADPDRPPRRGVAHGGGARRPGHRRAPHDGRRGDRAGRGHRPRPGVEGGHRPLRLRTADGRLPGAGTARLRGGASTSNGTPNSAASGSGTSRRRCSATFFHSLCCAARCNLQISARGGNDHHKAEAIFKAFARALRMAVARTGFGYDIPSSKGIL